MMLLFFSANNAPGSKMKRDLTPKDDAKLLPKRVIMLYVRFHGFALNYGLLVAVDLLTNGVALWLACIR
jgi:hypothetical protein